MSYRSELEAQLAKVRSVFEYANKQADRAQLRLLKSARGKSNLYDDTYWQPVLDRIRFELQQALENKDE